MPACSASITTHDVVDRLESPLNDGPEANGIAGVVATLLTRNFENVGVSKIVCAEPLSAGAVDWPLPHTDDWLRTWPCARGLHEQRLWLCRHHIRRSNSRTSLIARTTASPLFITAIRLGTRCSTGRATRSMYAHDPDEDRIGGTAALPDVPAITAYGFDLAAELLAAQKDFAVTLTTTLTPGQADKS